MKFIINGQVVLSRPPEGPLAAHLAAFAQWVSEQGYALYSLYRRVLLAACFSRWLGEKGVRLGSVSSEHPIRYLRDRARRVRPARGDAAALKQLMEFLRRKGVMPAEKTPSRRLTPVEQCVQAFERYLREERRLASASILNYTPFIRSFLDDRFGNGPVTLASISTSAEVIPFRAESRV